MSVLKKLFTSTRFIAGIIAVLAVTLVEVFNIPEAMTDNISNTILVVAGLFISGKSFSDLGLALKGSKTK